MKIEVLGPGCAKCKATYDVVKRVVEENGIDALIVKIDDMEAIINAGIMTTPAVKVNG
ncbi:MAG: thioredoxin family protein, partial [Bacteroidales bacterium]|nr:thioredoxin family protein [Bacteroidales bacterium]